MDSTDNVHYIDMFKVSAVHLIETSELAESHEFLFYPYHEE